MFAYQPFFSPLFRVLSRVINGAKYSSIGLPDISRVPVNATSASGQGFDAPISSIAFKRVPTYWPPSADGVWMAIYMVPDFSYGVPDRHYDAMVKLSVYPVKAHGFSSFEWPSRPAQRRMSPKTISF